jgi:phosphoglycerate dehydrogenase-like enzyme
VALGAHFVRPSGESVIPREHLTQLDDNPGLTYSFLEENTPNVTPEQIQGVSAIVPSGSRVNAGTFADGAEDLAYVHVFGLGYDAVDVAACTAAGVAVTRARHSSVHSMAASALLLLLASSYRLTDKQRALREDKRPLPREHWGHVIEGKVLGIVGLGDIGRELVRLVQPFQMTVLASDPYVDPDLFRLLGVESVELDELLQRSDLVSLHCCLTPETRGLIGARELRLMKPTAYIVNTARGPVIDQQALVQALTEGWIAGAGIDVFEIEPLPPDDPLRQLDNVILTPHVVGQSEEGVWRCSETVINQVLAAARGEIPDHVLNPEVLETGAFQDKLVRIRRRL